VWGKKAESVGELEPHAPVLFEGKLKKVRKGEAWEIVVSGFDCQPLQMPVGVAVEERAMAEAPQVNLLVPFDDQFLDRLKCCTLWGRATIGSVGIWECRDAVQAQAIA